MHMSRLPIYALAVVFALSSTNSIAQAAPNAFDPASSLRSRVQPADDDTLKIFAESGAVGARVHRVTAREWTRVEQALAALPRLHRAVLQQRLARVSFVDAPKGGGNALTRDIGGDASHPIFAIALRADILNETLSDFLTTKERSLFATDGSDVTVSVEAGQESALTYVLLHEATHVLDLTYGISSQHEWPFMRGIWLDHRRLTTPFDRSLVTATPFRREAPLPTSRAAELYAALARTPFTSLYATAAAPEDFAELFAWQQLADQGISPVIVVRGPGRATRSFAQLRAPRVKARLRAVRMLLAADELILGPPPG